MQSGKSAAAMAKEKAENVGASAKSGMEKTKATVQEMVDKMRAHEPAEKAAAEQLKERRKQEAEMNKQAMMEENAADRKATGGGGGGGGGGVGQEHHHITIGHGTDDTIRRSPVVRERNVDSAAATPME